MYLLLYTRDGQTCRHALRPGDTVVGRASICDLPIEDPSISRRHVRFRVHGDHCFLTDIGGRNGTFLNGELVTEAEVRAGDSIVLGRVPIRVDHGDSRPFVLSDDHALVESADTLLRRVDDDTETNANMRSQVSPDRLLLLMSEIARQLVPSRSLGELLERIVSVARHDCRRSRVSAPRRGRDRRSHSLRPQDT